MTLLNKTFVPELMDESISGWTMLEGTVNLISTVIQFFSLKYFLKTL